MFWFKSSAFVVKDYRFVQTFAFLPKYSIQNRGTIWLERCIRIEQLQQANEHAPKKWVTTDYARKNTRY